QSPVPFIQNPLQPSAIAPGGGDLTLTLSGSGSAHFVERVLATHDRTNNLVTGDFNGDGRLDVATTGQTGIIEVFLGNPSGSFAAPVDSTVGTGYNDTLVTGDFNGDGKLDLATTFGIVPSMVAVLLGNGDGTFQPQRNFAVANFPVAMVAGDFNGDG